MRSAIFVTALFLLLGFDRPEALACSCMESGPPCQSYFKSDIVFIGTVRSIQPVAGAELDSRLRVEFEQAIPSRGVQGASITVFTSDSGSSCGYPFQQGERYVVYGYQSKDGTGIHAGLCSRTRPLKDADEDVRFFETFSKPAAAPLVYGSIHRVDRDPVTGDPNNAGPIADVVMTLTGSGRSFQARTDRDGRYVFTGAGPGQYLLTGVPPRLFSSAPLRAGVDLRDARACHEANFGLRYDSRVIGSIVDAKGRPVSDAMVLITPAAKVGNTRYFSSEVGTSDKEGKFELTEVPPDRYILGVNEERPDDVRSPTTYYPNVTDPARATVFEVQAGEHVTFDPLVIPPAPPAYRLSGRVVLPDGKPAAGVEISLEDGHPTGNKVAAMIKTGADGSFSFLVHEGLAYVAVARYEDPALPGRTQAVGSMPFVASEQNVKTIEIVLSPVRRR